MIFKTSSSISYILLIFSTVLIIFFDLFKSSILYSGIINLASAYKKLILKEYFFSKYSISLDNLFSI